MGDDVAALGYPDWGPGSKITFVKGGVSSIITISTVKYYRVSMKLYQGISGAPLFDDEWNVVGIAHKGGNESARDLAVMISELTGWAAK